MAGTALSDRNGRSIVGSSFLSHGRIASLSGWTTWPCLASMHVVGPQVSFLGKKRPLSGFGSFYRQARMGIREEYRPTKAGFFILTFFCMAPASLSCVCLLLYRRGVALFGSIQ